MEQEIINDSKASENTSKVADLRGNFKYCCEDCENSFITKNRVNNCIICNSSRISEEDLEKLNSLLVLPFVKTRDNVVRSYKRKVFINPIIPFVFKRKKTINLVKKIYIKTTSVSLKVSGETIFSAIDKNKSSKVKYKVVLNSNFDYDNLLVNNICKVDDNIFYEVGDYKLNNLSDFNNDLMDTEVYILDNDFDLEEKIRDNALKCSLNVIRDNIKHDVKKLDKNNLEVEVTSKKEVLIPMYVIGVKYKEKNYFYLMNGVTGENILDAPVGRLELILFSVIFFLIVFVLFFLIAYFL